MHYSASPNNSVLDGLGVDPGSNSAALLKPPAGTSGSEVEDGQAKTAVVEQGEANISHSFLNPKPSKSEVF